MMSFVAVAQLVTPLFLLVIPLYALARGVDVYGVFLRGAAEGLRSIARVAPAIICMFTAVGLLSDSGALDAAGRAISPVAQFVGLPADLIMLALIRPVSGSGGLTLLTKILDSVGPDSPEGILASTIQGSTDTALYIMAVYFSSVGVTRTRHAPFVALMSALAGIAASVVACRFIGA
jgi:spore maturation protein B